MFYAILFNNIYFFIFHFLFQSYSYTAIEITNEGTADANIFRAKVHIEEIKESVENDSFAPDDATTYERPDQSHARDTGQSEVVQNSSKGSMFYAVIPYIQELGFCGPLRLLADD